MIGAAPRFFCARCGARRDSDGACDRDGAPLAAISASSLLGIEVGNYVLVELLGEGGMGSVYRAVQPSIGAEVAIKVLRMPAGPSDGVIVQRALLEARAVNRVRHASLIRILDTGVLADQRPYLVMELLDGVSLDAVIGALGPAVACHVVCAALDVLELVHDNGIVHRDLKPANVFLTREGRVVVLDFGIAKLVAPDRGAPTTSTGLLGTPEYMAPEQIRSLPVDRRTDIYAMGITLYEAITGRRPFAAAATFDMLVQHLETPPPSPREWVPDLAPAIADAILRALEKDPERRFETASAMAREVRAACAAPASRADVVAVVAAHAPAARPVANAASPAALAPTAPAPETIVESRRGPALPSPRVTAATRDERPRTQRQNRVAIVAGLCLAAGTAIAIARIGSRDPDPVPETAAVVVAVDAAVARAPADATTGELEVTSDPSGAALDIDRVARGRTPTTLTLAPGTHQLHVELRGHRAVGEAVDVIAGQRASVLVALPIDGVHEVTVVPTHPAARGSGSAAPVDYERKRDPYGSDAP